MTDQLARLGVQSFGRLEVVGHAVLQQLGLADVNHLAGLILVHVNAGLHGQLAHALLQLFSCHANCPPSVSYTHLLPNDLQQAQEIVAKRSEMLASGKREAEAIRRQAEEDARQMVSETEIVVAARRKAKEVQGNAEIQARELRRVANEYCEDTLKRTEEAVALGLEEVRKARQRFKSIAK